MLDYQTFEPLLEWLFVFNRNSIKKRCIVVWLMAIFFSYHGEKLWAFSALFFVYQTYCLLEYVPEGEIIPNHFLDYTCKIGRAIRRRILFYQPQLHPN